MADMSERPRINMEPSPADRLLEMAGWALLLLLWGLTLYNFITLPAVIPTHFNFAGKVDNYGSKTTLLILPLAGTFLFFSLTMLNKRPHSFNYPVPITGENARAQYALATRLLRVMQVAIMAVFAVVMAMISSAVRGSAGGLGLWFVPLILVFFAGLTGVYISSSLKAR